jgi:hypothetical protein
LAEARTGAERPPRRTRALEYAAAVAFAVFVIAVCVLVGRLLTDDDDDGRLNAPERTDSPATSGQLDDSVPHEPWNPSPP